MRLRKRRRRVEGERQVDDDAVVCRQKANLAWRPSGRLLDDARDRRAVALDLLAAECLGERLEVRLHGAGLRNRLPDGALDLLRDLVCVLERQLTRQLQMQ